MVWPFVEIRLMLMGSPGPSLKTSIESDHPELAMLDSFHKLLGGQICRPSRLNAGPEFWWSSFKPLDHSRSTEYPVPLCPEAVML
jgi:hypothetical protein